MKLDDLFISSVSPKEAQEQEHIQGNFISMAKRIEFFAQNHADAIALVDSTSSWSYATLWNKAQELAHFIVCELKPSQKVNTEANTETSIAILTGRNNYYYAAMLGVWLARCVAVPLDPSLPKPRLRHMLHDSKAEILVTDFANAGLGERISQDCKALHQLICIEGLHFEDAVEQKNNLMNKELWNLIAQDSADGSWKSYFNAKPLSSESLLGMAQNVCTKLESFFHTAQNILDIGGGSGIVAQAIIDKSPNYTAFELCEAEAQRINAYGREYSKNVQAHVMEASDINIAPQNYDVIVINSVIENFPGYNYLRHVLNGALEHLEEDGAIFLGMVWDADKKQHFEKALHEYAAQSGDSSAILRFAAEEELYVSKAFFEDFALQRGDIHLEFSNPQSGLAELDHYRYDVIITKNTSKQEHTNAYSKQRFGLKHVHNAKQNPAICSLKSIESTDAAYIIYTSGSTGKPKGALLEHISLMNLMDNMLEQVYVPFTQGQVKSAVIASFCFDASLQAWATLCHGGSLFIIADSLRHNPEQLHNFLKNNDIELCDGTPSLFGLLLDYWQQSASTPSVKVWILGGEVLHLHYLSKFYALSNQEAACIFNAYGPTECCVNTTLHKFSADNWQEHSSPPLGKKLSGCNIMICDAKGHAVPDGIPAELWIGGLGLARGYVHNAELSKEAFIHKDGVRWYKSGDIVCRRNGLIFYIAREDGQVKINGYRIELSEVEAVLKACPLVEQASIVMGDFLGNNMPALAAYVVPSTGINTCDASPDYRSNLEKNLRAYLLQKLPSYAVPAFFIPMHTLPLTPSGKVDRKNLPSPTATKAKSSGRSVQGQVEQALADMWSKLLGQSINDAEADFFTLGGHSILGVRLIGLIEAYFKRRLPLSAIFTNPSIAQQAKLISQEPNQSKGQSNSQNQGQVQILELASSKAIKETLFLFHPAGGSTVCYAKLAKTLSPSMNIYAVEPPPLLERRDFLSSTTTMAETYAKAISEHLKHTNQQQYYVGGWSFGGILALETARLLQASGLKEKALIIIDTTLNTSLQRSLVFMDEVDFLMALLGEDMVGSDNDLKQMSKEQRLAQLVHRGIELGRLPSGFNEEHMQALIQTFHANALAGARYTPRPLACNALLLRAQNMDKNMSPSEDIYLGWREHILHDLQLQWIAGTHETILQDQNVEHMAKAINNYRGSLA